MLKCECVWMIFRRVGGSRRRSSSPPPRLKLKSKAGDLVSFGVCCLRASFSVLGVVLMGLVGGKPRVCSTVPVD